MAIQRTSLAQYQAYLAGIITTCKRNNAHAVSAISEQVKELKIPELLSRQDILMAKSETIKANRAIKNCVINSKGKNPLHKMILRVWYGIRTIFRKSPYPTIDISLLVANARQTKPKPVSISITKKVDSDKVKESKQALNQLQTNFVNAGLPAARSIGAYEIAVEEDGSLSVIIIEKGVAVESLSPTVYTLKKEGDGFRYQTLLFSSASDFLEYYALEAAKIQLSSPEILSGGYVDMPDWETYTDAAKDTYQLTRYLKQENGEIVSLPYIERKKFQAEVAGKISYFSSAEQVHHAIAHKLGVTLKHKAEGQEIYASGIDEAKDILSQREPGDWLIIPLEEKIKIVIVGDESPPLTHEFIYLLRDSATATEKRKGDYPLKPARVGVANDVQRQIAVLKEVEQSFFVTDPVKSVQDQVETLFEPFSYREGDIPIESPYIILSKDQGKKLATAYGLGEGAKFDADFYIVARAEKGPDDKLFFSRMNPIKVMVDGRLWDGARSYDTMDAIRNQWHLPMVLNPIEDLQGHAKMLLEDIAIDKDIERVEELLKGKKSYSLVLKKPDDFTSLILHEYNPHFLTMTTQDSYSITVLPNGQVSKRSAEGKEIERYLSIVEFKASLEKCISLKTKDAKRSIKEAEIERRYAELSKVQSVAKEASCSSEKEAWTLLNTALSLGYPADNCCFVYAKPESFELGVLFVSDGKIQTATLFIKDKIYLKRGVDEKEVSAANPFVDTELTFKDAEVIRRKKEEHTAFISGIKTRKDFRDSMAATDIEALAKNRLLDDSQKKGGYVISIEYDQYGIEKPYLYEIDENNRIQKKQITHSDDLNKIDTSKGIDSLKRIVQKQEKKWQSAGSKIRAMDNFVPGIAEKLSVAKLEEAKRYFGTLEPGVFTVSQHDDQPPGLLQKAGLWIGKKLGGERLLQKALVGETGKYVFACVDKEGDIKEYIVSVDHNGQYVLHGKSYASLEGADGLLQAIGATNYENRVADMEASKKREAYIEQQRYFYPSLTDERVKQIRERAKFIGPSVLTRINDGEYVLCKIDDMSKQVRVFTRSKPGKYETDGGEFSSLEELMGKFIS